MTVKEATESNALAKGVPAPTEAAVMAALDATAKAFLGQGPWKMAMPWSHPLMARPDMMGRLMGNWKSQAAIPAMIMRRAADPAALLGAVRAHSPEAAEAFEGAEARAAERGETVTEQLMALAWSEAVEDEAYRDPKPEGSLGLPYFCSWVVTDGQDLATATPASLLGRVAVPGEWRLLTKAAEYENGEDEFYGRLSTLTGLCASERQGAREMVEDRAARDPACLEATVRKDTSWREVWALACEECKAIEPGDLYWEGIGPTGEHDAEGRPIMAMHYGT